MLCCARCGSTVCRGERVTQCGGGMLYQVWGEQAVRSEKMVSSVGSEKAVSSVGSEKAEESEKIRR